MNIADLQRAKDSNTAKASDVVRQFAFAGIAVVWLLRSANAAEPIPAALIPALPLFGLALACDLLQYVVSSIIWTTYYRLKLKQHIAETTEFDEPWLITLPAYVLFAVKIIFSIVAWVVVACYLVGNWKLFGWFNS
ncbi:hypothetical protein [Lysobacter antibioticus]|uniref:hypothetical protein n=1 Tax=Lysobacter antibioticus TaxID=84531 RepID=UPI0011DFB0C1|nr:hypothetical protein [Lysobacter antibioticus]